jgi:hypothetical protein
MTSNEHKEIQKVKERLRLVEDRVRWLEYTVKVQRREV